MTFKVDRMPAVNQQIKQLAERAEQHRIKLSYLDALDWIIDRLANDPLGWGDPLHRTKTPGGVICRGITWPVCMHFVVFETARVVIITHMTPLPGSPLAEA